MTKPALNLIIIGAGTVLPCASRSPSCHLLQIGEKAFVFDLGPGSLPRLASAGMDYRDIDTVFISHLHPDHVIDIITLLQATNATPGWNRTKPLTFYGCRGLEEFIRQLLLIFRDAVPETYVLNIVELDVGRHEIEELTVEAALTGHTSNSLAFRIEAGDSVFVYSGDAADVPELVSLAQNADIFLCECSFPQGYHTEDHLTSETSARIAHKAAVQHLVLTHTYPSIDHVQTFTDASQIFSGKLTIAVDGTIIRAGQ
jgi:ribonuclease Z